MPRRGQRPRSHPFPHDRRVLDPCSGGTANAVIDKGRGYEGPDGSSKMPSFNDDLTVRDLVDLVAYLTSLKPAAAAPAAPPDPPPGGSSSGGRKGH